MTPYINELRRQTMRNAVLVAAHTPGELNYLITQVVIDFLGSNPDYTRFNAAVGAVESAKLELYRRMVAPYEDRKIKEHGDVYP